MSVDARTEYERWRTENPQLAALETRLDQLLNRSGMQEPERPVYDGTIVSGGSDFLHAAQALRYIDTELATRLDYRTIYNDAGSPYLTRTYLSRTERRELPGLFLHYFHRSDSDRELHNHPWEMGVAFVLTGGYVEHRMEGRDGTPEPRYVAPFTANVLYADTFHRVDLATSHCWTLFVAARRHSERTPEREGWGFIDLETRHYEDVVERDRRVRGGK